MSATPEQRAAWIAGVRRLLDILDANPDLGIDGPGFRKTWPLTIDLSGYDESGPAALGAWEDTLHADDIPFAPHLRAICGDDPDAASADYYDLDGTAGGLSFRVRFRLRDVAERTVTGTRTVEDVEWVRLPVPDDEAQEGPVEE